MYELARVPYLANVATKLALTSEYGKFRLGAIIAQKNKIVSLGTNNKKSHPIQKKFSHRPHLSSWRHAEIHAISLANAGDLEGADVYVARALADGSLGSSRPCEGCCRALKHFGLRNMIYWEDGKWIKESV